MPVKQGLPLLDYASSGYPFVIVPAKTSIVMDGLDNTSYGMPFWASLGEVSASIMRTTQVVSEYLRDATDVGGGGLRSTQFVSEMLVTNNEQIYLTTLVTERLARAIDIPLVGKSWMVFDEVGFIDVSLRSGSLVSVADDYAVLNGENMALWGQELIGFKTVQSLGSDRYRLTWLLRGRFGTEWAMRLHSYGDQFILVNLATIKRVLQVESDINVGKLYKAVTIGASIDQATVRVLSNTAAGLKPYAPCFVAGSRDGGNNLTITWYRRTRYDGEWRDAVEVSVGETEEYYEIDILSSAGLVLRTIESPIMSAAYSAADQTTDFGGAQALIVVVVYQISAIVGRGYGTTIAI